MPAAGDPGSAAGAPPLAAGVTLPAPTLAAGVPLPTGAPFPFKVVSAMGRSQLAERPELSAPGASASVPLAARPVVPCSPWPCGVPRGPELALPRALPVLESPRGLPAAVPAPAPAPTIASALSPELAPAPAPAPALPLVPEAGLASADVLFCSRATTSPLTPCALPCALSWSLPCALRCLCPVSRSLPVSDPTGAGGGSWPLSDASAEPEPLPEPTSEPETLPEPASNTCMGAGEPRCWAVGAAEGGEERCNASVDAEGKGGKEAVLCA